jgi:hypothetical protein
LILRVAFLALIVAARIQKLLGLVGGQHFL